MLESIITRALTNDPRWKGSLEDLSCLLILTLRMNQGFIAVCGFFKFTDVDGENGYIWKHLVQSLNDFSGKVRLLFRASAFHDVPEDVDEILFIFAQLEILIRPQTDFDIVLRKETRCFDGIIDCLHDLVRRSLLKEVF